MFAPSQAAGMGGLSKKKESNRLSQELGMQNMCRCDEEIYRMRTYDDDSGKAYKRDE